MKGYSFQELVKLAEAAVKRAGDIMTGNLTAPKVLVSGAQGTEANTLTRKDYVDNELSKKLSLTGGTMTGALYIDQALHSRSVNVNDISSGARLVIVPQGDSERFTIDMYPASSAAYQVMEFKGSDRTTSFKQIVSCEAGPVAASHLTRKDYVDSAIAAGDALQVSKTGDTMTGNLTTPKVLVSGAQGTESNALTRKDYVDSATALKVNKAGDTMTGKLNVPSFSDIATGIGLSSRPFEVLTNWGYPIGTSKFVQYTSSNSPAEFTGGYWFTLGARDMAEGYGGILMDYNSGHKVWIGKSVSGTGAPVWTKLYSDRDKPTAADVGLGNLANYGWNYYAVANTYAVRDESADVHARLLRATVGDDAWMGGAIAFRINNSDDNYTRYCNNPVAVREWMRSAKTEWSMDWRAYIEHSAYPMTEYHIPGSAAVITYLSGDGAYRIASSDGSGVGSNDRLSLDSSGNLFTQAAIHEAGQRVYSPHNQPHYSHNHTAAQGNSDIVADGYGQIGTYGFFYNLGAAAPVGTQRSGSTLRWSGARNNSTGGNPSGTWKCVGHAFQSGASEGEACTLWVRIA